MTGAPLRCIIYIRVSSEHQVEKYGLAAQERATRAAAEQRGYQVVAVIVDGGISGKKVTREGFDEVRRLVREGAGDVVLTLAHDRFWRNTGEHLLFLHYLRRHGVRHDYVAFTPEDTKEGRFIETVFAGQAELERETIRERTMRGTLEKARRGLKPSGPINFGFRRDAAALGGLAVDEGEAATVRRIFEWLAAGDSLRAIEHRLNAQGIPSPRGGRWTATTIRNIVMNDLYLGRGVHNRRQRVEEPEGEKTSLELRPEAEWIRFAVTPIVSVGLAERARAQLERNVALLGGRPSKRVFLLGGLIWCACGRRMHGHYRDKNPSHYRCAGRLEHDRELRCSRSSRADDLEELVWITLKNLVNDPDALRSEAKASRLGIDARRVDAQTELADLGRALEKVRASRRRLVDLHIDGRLERADFDARELPLAAEATRLEAAIAHAEGALVAGQAEAERHASIVAWCKLVSAGLEKLDAAGRQAFLRKILARVTVLADRVELVTVWRGDDDATRPMQALEADALTSQRQVAENTQGLPSQTPARLAQVSLSVPRGGPHA